MSSSPISAALCRTREATVIQRVRVGAVFEEPSRNLRVVGLDCAHQRSRAFVVTIVDR